MYPLRLEYHKLIKLLIIGNSGVGKSSLLNRFADNDFREQYIYTIGVDFKVRTLNIDGKIVKLQIWDTAGQVEWNFLIIKFINFILKKLKILKQERFRAFTAAYFRGAHGVVVVYDISDKNSFTCVTNWLRDIEKHCSDQNVIILLIGNKCDINEKRLVSYEEALEFASQMGVLFIETSAKSGTNVEAAFQLIATKILINSSDFVSNNNQHNSSTINISSPDSCNKFCCYRWIHTKTYEHISV